VFRRELTIKGSFAQSYSFDRAVLALRSGRVRSDGLVTNRFDLASYAQAVETVRTDRSCVKAVVEL
jgi:D-arabinitol dehydrogenase (NADP+)